MEKETLRQKIQKTERWRDIVADGEMLDACAGFSEYLSRIELHEKEFDPGTFDYAACRDWWYEIPIKKRFIEYLVKSGKLK